MKFFLIVLAVVIVVGLVLSVHMPHNHDDF